MEVYMARFARVKELSDYIHIKERTIRSYVLEKRIPHMKVNGCVVFDLDDIDEWMHARSVEPIHINNTETREK